MRYYVNERSAGITQGGEAYLDEKWKDKGVLLCESKMFFILDGELVIRTYKGELICREGDLVLIPAGVRHDYYLSDGGAAHKYWFHFNLKNESVSIFERYELPFSLSVPESEREETIRLFEKALSEGADESEALMQISALYALVAYYVKASGARESAAVRDEIDRVLAYIDEHLSEEITLSELARVACLSPNYFVRKFKSRLGVAPLKYVSIARMEYARKLLANSTLSIADVMTRVGFCDSSHFSKAFKAFTGYSPRAFRNVTLK